jgi:hypothetical protein
VRRDALSLVTELRDGLLRLGQRGGEQVIVLRLVVEPEQRREPEGRTGKDVAGRAVECVAFLRDQVEGLGL